MSDEVKLILSKARSGELKPEIGYSGPDTKYIYHFAVTDPTSGKVVIGTGTPGGGPDYSWGFEVENRKKSEYL